MINRSKIKYSLKKLLPKIIFGFILALWQKLFIKIVNVVDRLRLKNFTKYQVKKINHQGHTISIFISPENGFIDEYIYLNGTYEPHILDIIAKYLRGGSTFVDIGANIGQHSLFAATIVGRNGKVYSFEPIPHVYKQLLDSVKINHFEDVIDVHNIALGEEDRVTTLYVDKYNIGGSSVVKAERKDAGEIVVKMKKADDVLSNIKHIDVIKIDVEGYEYEALLGMQKTLALHKPVIILEFSGQMYSFKGKNDGDKIISLLQKIGYDIYDVEDYMKKITSKTAFLSEFSHGKIQCDILCLPQNLNHEI